MQWMPEKCLWKVTFRGAPGEDTVYCKQNDISLEVQSYLQGNASAEAREKAFHDAIKMWNALDKSKKRRT